MTPVHQKPKHCLIACLVSALEDKRLRDAQTDVVSHHGALCKAGTNDEGVVGWPNDFRVLVQGLGLSNDVVWVNDPANVLAQLKANKHKAVGKDQCYILITSHPTNHAVRLHRVLGSGINVMDPSAGRFVFWKWKRLKYAKCRLAFFNF